MEKELNHKISHLEKCLSKSNDPKLQKIVKVAKAINSPRLNEEQRKKIVSAVNAAYEKVNKSIQKEQKTEDQKIEKAKKKTSIKKKKSVSAKVNKPAPKKRATIIKKKPRNYTYIPNDKILKIEAIKDSGNTVDIKAPDILDGAYVKKHKYAKGGHITDEDAPAYSRKNYVGKRVVIPVQIDKNFSFYEYMQNFKQPTLFNVTTFKNYKKITLNNKPVSKKEADEIYEKALLEGYKEVQIEGVYADGGMTGSTAYVIVRENRDEANSFEGLVFSESDFDSWLSEKQEEEGEDFDADDYKTIRVHVYHPSKYSHGGIPRASHIFKNAKNRLSSGYSKSKEYAKKAVSSGYSKSKEYAKQKVKDFNKKVALDVLDKTKDKVGNDQKMHLKAAQEIIKKKYESGGLFGGRKYPTGAAWAKEHKYKSKESHEKKYVRRSDPKNKTYKAK